MIGLHISFALALHMAFVAAEPAPIGDFPMTAFPLDSVPYVKARGFIQARESVSCNGDNATIS
jgi:hypothetical protein